MSDTKTNYDRGLELRRVMFGPQGADDQIDNASDYMAPMQDIVTRICFGEGWQRPVFDRKLHGRPRPDFRLATERAASVMTTAALPWPDLVSILPFTRTLRKTTDGELEI